MTAHTYIIVNLIKSNIQKTQKEFSVDEGQI